MVEQLTVAALIDLLKAQKPDALVEIEGYEEGGPAFGIELYIGIDGLPDIVLITTRG